MIVPRERSPLKNSIFVLFTTSRSESHSGILFDGNVSSKYLDPLAFEPLLTVKDIRFALAHLGNPWVDETILLYAKFQAVIRNMQGKYKFRVFLDLTPGVTRIRRRDALRMLLLSGYANPSKDILWGTDNRINGYDTRKAAFWRDFDRKIIDEIMSEIHTAPDFYPSLPDDLWERITETNYADFSG